MNEVQVLEVIVASIIGFFASLFIGMFEVVDIRLRRRITTADILLCLAGLVGVIISIFMFVAIVIHDFIKRNLSKTLIKW